MKKRILYVCIIIILIIISCVSCVYADDVDEEEMLADEVKELALETTAKVSEEPVYMIEKRKKLYGEKMKRKKEQWHLQQK